MKHRLFSYKKLRSLIAAFAVSLILVSTVTGCSPEAVQKQMEALSDTYNNMASQIASSFNSSSMAGKGSPSAARKSSASSRSSIKITNNSSAPSAPAKADVQTVRKITAALPAATTPKKSVTETKASSSKYSAVLLRNSYLHLTTQTEKTLYLLIADNVNQVALQKNSSGYYPIGQISLSDNLSEAQIRVALMAYMDDNPQVFWLAGAYSYGYQGSRTILQLYSVYSPDQCNAAVQRLNSSVSSVMNAMPSGLNQFDREEYIFNYIVNHCTYNNAAANDNSIWQAFTSYGTLVDGTAVCEGYSRAMQLLSSYAGINSSLIRGSSDGVGHMWNAVLINGAWYHLDVTWSDNTILIYNYYNVDDSVIRQTHSVGPSVSSLSEDEINSGEEQFNIYLPACTSTAANYFQVKGIPVSTLSSSGDSAVVQAIASKLKAGRKSLAFLVGGNYNTMVNGMMTSSPYKMATWLSAAEKLAGRSLDISKSNYVTDKADSGLTLQITYR